MPSIDNVGHQSFWDMDIQHIITTYLGQVDGEYHCK